MNNRRLILLSMIGLMSSLGSMLLFPRAAFAKWIAAAFEAKTTDKALVGLFNNKEIIESDRILLKIPEIAENGAVVPVNINTDLPNVETISLFAEKNLHPLSAAFTIPKGTTPNVSVRIRLAETMNVKAIVKSDGKLYSTQKEVKVTIGGCGG